MVIFYFLSIIFQKNILKIYIKLNRTTDMVTFFEEFCADAKIITPNNQELIDLAKFEEAIVKYEGIRNAIQQVIFLI
jgi:hydroxymethylpyrimidine/phosphomethylpyrimidine kinase